MTANGRDSKSGMRTPGSTTEAWKKEDEHTKNKYAKMIGIAGDTWCHSHAALVPRQHAVWPEAELAHSRVHKEKHRGKDEDDSGSNVDGPVARVLQTSAPPENRVALKILVVFA